MNENEIRLIAIPPTCLETAEKLKFYSEHPKARLAIVNSPESRDAYDLLVSANFRVISIPVEGYKPELCFQNCTFVGLDEISRLINGIEEIKKLLPLIVDHYGVLPNLTLEQILNLVKQTQSTEIAPC